MAFNNFKELIVWQKSMNLVTEIYKLLKYLPKEETYALSSQMRRSAISIPSNIAEGKQRATAKDYSKFLLIAKGSAAELEKQLIICINLEYFSKEQLESTLKLCEEIQKMLTALSDKILQSGSDNN